MSSYIQIPFGYRKKSNPLQFTTSKSNYENRLLENVGYIKNADDPKIKNNLLNAIKSREDLQKYILANSDVGYDLQEDINAITSGDEKFNNAAVRRALDLKNNDLFRNPQPITLLFHDIERFHQQNPIIGKLATQINVPKLSNRDEIRRKLLEGDIRQIENRLFNLRNDNNTNTFPIGGNNNNNGGINRGGDDDSNDSDGDDPPPPASGSRIGALREKIAVEDPAFKKKEPERDLQDTFNKLRFGRPIPKPRPDRTPVDPFSPDFWHKVTNDPRDTMEAKMEDETVRQREDQEIDLPPPPLFEPTKKVSFDPMTKTLDGERIQIHHPTEEISEERQISERIQKLFPDVGEINKNEKKADVIVKYENLSETLGSIEPTENIPFDFEFFNGGSHRRFAEILENFADDNEDITEFINFLQGDICRNILENNKLKIHVDSGKIFYENEDTNESIFNFILAQNNPISGYIERNISFDQDYKTYFQWVSSAFSETEKNKLDISTNVNSKFLFYRFNDLLQQQSKKTKRIKHSVVTKDYIAGEKIQDTSWKYFIESILRYAEKPNSNYSDTEQSFVIDTKENIEILKKTYDELFRQIEKNHIEMLEGMPFDFFKDIENDLRRELYLEEDFLKLDTWISFYFRFGRFPGEQELTILPQSEKPKTINPLSTEFSPLELYKEFGKKSSKNIVSFQAIVALYLHHGGSALTAKRAMEEWKNNLTFQTLSAENDKNQIKFDKLSKMMLHLFEEFEKMKNYFSEYEKVQLKKTEKTKALKIRTSTPIKFYKRPKITVNSTLQDESAFIKTALTLENTNINATIEKEEEDNRETIQSIIDPTPGSILTQTAPRDILESREQDESGFKLGNGAQKRLDNILDNIFENIKIPQPSNEEVFKIKTEGGNEIEKSTTEIKIKKQPEFTSVISRPKRKLSRTSPYNLRQRKSKFLKSEEALTGSIDFAVDDNVGKKIDRVEKLIDSVVNRSGKVRQEFVFDENNNIVIE